MGKPDVDGGAAGARAGRDAGNDDKVVEGLDAGLLLAIVAVVALAVGIAVVRRRRRAQARAARYRQVTAAAAGAAREDPDFAPANVKAAAAALYVDLQRAWSERDVAALERGLGPELLADWQRRLKGYEQRGRVSERTIVEGPRVEYAGLVNREGIGDDRVTVAMTALLNCTVRDDSGGPADPGLAALEGDVGVSEYWTLASHGDGRRVVEIDGDRRARTSSARRSSRCRSPAAPQARFASASCT